MLTKLKIEAYRDETFGSKIDDWEAQINPELYRREFRTLFNKDRGIDTAGTVSRYRSIDVEELTLEVVLDATGVVDGVDSVTDEIERFKAVAYSYNGDIHSPNYLRLLWGELVFNCMLERLTVSYVLFSPSGEPLRARLSITVRGHRTPEEIAQTARKSSPDLAHTRRIRDQVGLPVLCAEIYGDPRYNVDVAHFNQLTSLRRLQIGREISFPPLGAER